MRLDRFINKPVLSTVISVFIVIFGLLGLSGLAIEQYPNIAPPTIMVSTTYTGASAQAVLNSVIAPLEEQINGAENMDYMVSSASNNGSATIQVYFKQGMDPDMAAVDVQNRVAKAAAFLPAEVNQVGVITQKRQTSMLMVMGLYDETDTYTSQFIDNYMLINIIPEIKRVSGVGDAMAFGADYSMRIWLKPDVMAQYGLMPSDISAVLAEQNIEAAPGAFGEQGNQTFQYTMRYKGRLQDEKEFEDIVVRATKDGEILRLSDVADIELGKVSYGFGSRQNGHVGSAAIVFQSAGSNATEVIKNIEKLQENARKSLPKGLKLETTMSANDFLFASIHEVFKTLIEAFILVFLVVFIFLQDFRSTLIPMIAIPVALIGTFFLLYIFGFTLNLLTLSALVLAIAIVVDDAIVVVEAVHAKLDEGYQSARKASIDAMSEIGSALVSITLVMMLVFIPVSFLPGTSGIFYRQFGLTMAMAIGLSAINALTLSPALCAIFLKPHKKEGSEEDPLKNFESNTKQDNHKEKSNFLKRFFYWFNVVFDALLAKYKVATQWFANHKIISFSMVAASIGALVWLMNTTPTGLVPTEDTGTIMGAVTLPPASSQERTQLVMDELDSIIQSIPEVNSTTAITGYSFISGSQGSTYGSFIIKLKNWEERKRADQSASAILQKLYGMCSKITEANVMFFQPPMISGYSATNGFELKLEDKTGGSLDKFFGIYQKFIGTLNQQPEIQMAYSTFNPTFPQYLVEIDVPKVKQAGLTQNAVLSALQGYYGGMYISNFNSYGKLYRVMMQATPEARISPETLKQIKVRNGNEMAPIDNFVHLKRIYGPDVINRFNMFTSIQITGVPADGYSSGEAIAAINRVAEETLPTGFDFEFSGMTREEASGGSGGTATVFLLVLVFVYLILSAQYESYILPWAVILSIPFGLMGTFIFANMRGTDNNIYLQISLIMLIGLLAKNAILIIEYALDRRRTGMSIIKSAVQGSVARLRPILMTSLAMIIGLIPMMFATGAGANGNQALGTGAIGGMLIGMILQVLIVPSLFVAFQTLQEKFTPPTWSDKDNSKIKSELEQYSINRD